MSTPPESSTPPLSPASDAEWEEWASSREPHSLVDLINRVLDRGILLNGDVTISVAGVDLVYLGLNALLTSVSTARRTLGPSGLPAPPLPPTSEAAAAVSRLPPPTARSRDAGPPAVPSAARVPAPPGHEPPPDAIAAGLVAVAESMPARVDVDPEEVQRDLARLVLTLVELLRRVVEHQAVRRMEDADLSEQQVERMGTALLRLDEKMREIKRVFGLADEDLNIDLGSLGKLL